MSLSAKLAAERVGLTKAGIIKAIKSGKLSADKTTNGEWSIEPVELFRVYPPRSTPSPVETSTEVDAGTQSEMVRLHAELESLREMVRRADQRADEQQSRANEWRSKAEQESQERRALMAMLTDQREPVERKSIWDRFRGR